MNIANRELSDKLGEIDSQMAVFKNKISEVKLIGKKESEKLRGELKFNQILHFKRLDKIKMIALQTLNAIESQNFVEAKSICQDIISFIDKQSTAELKCLCS